MSSGQHTYTPAGRQRRATYVEVCKWVQTAWDKVKATTIINGFRKCGICPEISSQESSSEDESDVSDDESVSNEQLARAMDLFAEDSDYDESFDGFAESDVEEDVNDSELG
jgi:hypothetical protein